MWKTTLAGLRAHKLRLVATGLAIILGVGFVAGTLIFSDTAKAALYDQFARAAKNVDVSVLGAPAGDPTLAQSTVDIVGKVSGVGSVDGRMRQPLPLLDKKGKLVTSGTEPGLTLSAGTVAALRPYDLVAGDAPTGPGAAALDRDTAARTGYVIGDQITVLDQRQEKHRLTLVGVVSFGTSKQYAGQSVVILTDGAITGLTGGTGYSQVVASAAAGGSAQELAQRVAAALPGLRVTTGGQYRDDLANDAINQLRAFRMVLLIFALIACVVSAFVIYNTFNILIAQRVRQIALLRCVGAARGQIFGSVLLESAIVGLVAAVAGVGLGIGLGYGLFSGADALGAALPAHGVVLTANPIALALLLGIGVSVGSALLPALRATRVAPLAALRALPPADGRGARRWPLVAGALVVGALGTWLTVLGSTSRAGAEAATLLVVAGGLVNFFAILICGPLFIPALTAVLGWLPGKVFGVPARLAVNNARRNPGRAAATTAALMIGVGLMSSATVALATVKATTTEQLSLHYPVDFVLLPNNVGGQPAGIPAALSLQLRGAPELRTVAEVRGTPATLNGHRITLGTVDPTGMASLFGMALPLTAGTTATFGPGSIILFDGSPAARGVHVGDTVTLSADRGGTFRVAALVAGYSPAGDAVVGWDDFASLRSSTMDDIVLVTAADGVDPVRSRAAVEAVTDAYPLVNVSSLADWRYQITSGVNTLIAVVAALLAIAIIIALIGIVNTLSLSVFERTRESAMTRALGLTRGQLRATLLTEALLMGAVGAIVGVSFGVLYGWATTRVMFTGFAAVITIPVGQLLGYLALASSAAVVAALLPARHAARASIVAAMAET
jgi:putative ABC transport system permease protein